MSAITIILDEVGYDLSEITDSTTFEALGIDSLLTISISSRLKSEIDVELPASVFSSATIGQFPGYFKPDNNPLNISEDSSEKANDSSRSSGTGVFTTPSSTSLTTLDEESPSVLDVFLTTLAHEAGLDIQELDTNAAFSDLGVDSLMSIAVIGAVKYRTGTELPASIFADYQTVGSLMKALCEQNMSSGRTVSEPKGDFLIADFQLQANLHSSCRRSRSC